MKNIFLFIAMSFPIFLLAQSPVTKGDTQFEMGFYDGAIKSYQTALSGDDSDPALISKIAKCYARKNDFLQSANWYEKVVQTDNVSPDELLEYGQILKSLKLYGKAKHYFERYGMFDVVIGNHFIESCNDAIKGLQIPPAVEVTNPYFNTQTTDFAPAFFNDKLVYTSFRKDISKTRKAAYAENDLDSEMSDVFQVNPTDHSRVELLMDNIEDHSWIGPIAFSGNEKVVAVTKNNFKANNRFFLSDQAALSIYFADVNENGTWENSKPFVFNDNSYSVGFPWLSEDGNTLIFSSNMPGGEGGYDLYMSYKEGHAWTTPENLGMEINTPGNEIAPFQTTQHLYFSSDWHAGFGGYDVFAISNLEVNPEIVNMGYGINSSKDDYGYIYNDEKEIGFLSSDRTTSRGGLDIYKVQGQIKEVTIKVLDKQTKEPVDNATITFVHIDTRLTTDSEGIVKVVLSKNTEEELIISRDGYHDINMKLTNLKQAKMVMKYDVLIEKKAMIDADNPIVAVDHIQVIKESEVVHSVVDVETSEPTRVHVEVERPIVKSVVEMEKNIPVTKKRVYVKAVQQEKYAIQVSAFGKGEFNREMYNNLEAYGKVYNRFEGNMTKVRVGYFDDKTSAAEMVRQVRKLGYKDAFVVTEMSIEGTDENQNSSAGNATGSQYFEDNSDYKVRLATYSKAGQFDAGKVEHLGKLESYRKNEMTIMLLAGYATLGDARLALKAAQMNGFSDAYVVKDMGGYLEKVNMD